MISKSHFNKTPKWISELQPEVREMILKEAMEKAKNFFEIHKNINLAPR